MNALTMKQSALEKTSSGKNAENRSPTAQQTAIEKIEIQLLLEAVYLKYGYDFRNYSRAHVLRRILHFFEKSGLENISAMQHKVLCDRQFLNELLFELSINVTEMFRDPGFFQAVRSTLVARLATYPFIKIWHAGCATGEEVYSMAILLKEENLYQRCQIYATDFNVLSLAKAESGIVSLEAIKQYTTSYQKAGGKQAFSDYYTAKFDYAKLKESLKGKIIFVDHNLATDSCFGEMNMIVCRNVLIYFNRELQNKVIKLFFDSLSPGGFLCLGTKESLQFSSLSDQFEQVTKKENIFRKKY